MQRHPRSYQSHCSTSNLFISRHDFIYEVHDWEPRNWAIFFYLIKFKGKFTILDSVHSTLSLGRMLPKTVSTLSGKAHFYQRRVELTTEGSIAERQRTRPAQTAGTLQPVHAVLLWLIQSLFSLKGNEWDVCYSSDHHDNINPHTGSPTLEMKPPRTLLRTKPKTWLFSPHSWGG